MLVAESCHVHLTSIRFIIPKNEDFFIKYSLIFLSETSRIESLFSDVNC